MKKIANNLHLIGNNVMSYTTHVATIEGDKLLVPAKWMKYSRTTTKHINLIVREQKLTIVIIPNS